jgi:hypothetical protein
MASRKLNQRITYSCEKCNEFFFTPYNLRSHSKYCNKTIRHHERKITRFACPECGVGCITREAFFLHLFQCHLNCEDIPCAICKFVTTEPEPWKNCDDTLQYLCQECYEKHTGFMTKDDRDAVLWCRGVDIDRYAPCFHIKKTTPRSKFNQAKNKAYATGV